MKRSIGKNTLGDGKKMKVDLKNYGRSTHNLSYTHRNTMSAGTLVPFLCKPMMPGDTFDIDLECEVLTHPTVGPLFGSYKVQLDTFFIPTRLYQAQLHNNELNVGLNMQNVRLPVIYMYANGLDWTKPVSTQQINPSCIFHYLGIKGVGNFAPDAIRGRYFNAIPWIGYWDIYKNYYANKQEEIGAVIHNLPVLSPKTITVWNYIDGAVTQPVPEWPSVLTPSQGMGDDSTMNITFAGDDPIPEQLLLLIGGADPANAVWQKLTDVYENVTFSTSTVILATNMLIGGQLHAWKYADASDLYDGKPKVYTFPLEGIDTLREKILQHPKATRYVIASQNGTPIEPFNLPLLKVTDQDMWSKQSNQEGLALKTYQADIFNNWMQTEWLDGPSGINAITSIDTSSGEFAINSLILARDIFNILNRVAISGGTYKDWIEATYTVEGMWRTITPIYLGGMSKELVFQEVISNSASEEQPLGTLAGRGRLDGQYKKGGTVVAKADEFGYVMGLISITPRIDYSQGNEWDTNVLNMDEWHKPGLDRIGFQDLITDRMAFWDTEIDTDNEPVFKSAGKQPAWIEYMTSVNQTHGNFAIEENEMFMTLNRRYEQDATGEEIKDLTTYIDPSKYNYIFAETNLDAMNFWVNVGVKIEARRKMSGKIMPNL